jgi:hypothetical protein
MNPVTRREVVKAGVFVSIVMILFGAGIYVAAFTLTLPYTTWKVVSYRAIAGLTLAVLGMIALGFSIFQLRKN